MWFTLLKNKVTITAELTNFPSSSTQLLWYTLQLISRKPLLECLN